MKELGFGQHFADASRLLGRYLMISLRAQMQYRASFSFSIVGSFLLTGIEFLGVWALFSRFDHLAGWSLAEVALFYAVVNLSFGVADAFSRGFSEMGVTVRQGDFDRLLLRPRSTLLQIAGTELALKRVGRLSQALIVLAWATASLSLSWTPGTLALLGFTITGGAFFFLALFVLQATICFWTIESLELMNTLTHGGVAAAQYPISIYGAAFRRFFTYVVPLSCVAYFPVVELLGRPDPLGSSTSFRVLAPAAGLLFFALAAGIWQLGVRRYASTGS